MDQWQCHKGRWRREFTMTGEEIIQRLPYTSPFLFVDKLIAVSDTGVTGCYTFDKNLFFYQGHFKDLPITPGVILTECMAQIGLVCLGIYLLDKQHEEVQGVAFAESEMQYFKPVFPGESVRVESVKEYFRFGKLKCKVSMFNTADELVCKGVLSGMLQKKS